MVKKSWLPGEGECGENPKHEIRKTKQYPSTNDQNSKRKRIPACGFRNLYLFRI